MPPKKQAPKVAEAAPINLKLERFVMTEVQRSQLQNAPYNPRVISESSKRKLKAVIKKLGIISPITWNKRTGNIVGGHQRLKIMDQIQGGKEYTLNVAAVDMNDIEEREANLALNNDAAQGMFDVEALTEMLSVPGMDLEATGWESADLIKLIGHDPTLAATQEKSELDMGEEAAGVDVDKYRIASERFTEASEERRAEGLSDYFLVVVFKTYSDRLKFTEAMGLDDNRYQSAEDICPAALRGKDLPETVTASNGVTEKVDPKVRKKK